jgi:hypothetical protein
MTRMRFRDVPKRTEAPAKAPDALAITQTYEARCRAARGAFDSSLALALNKRDALALVDAARATLVAELTKAEGKRDAALAQIPLPVSAS